jgi:flagellar motility protein MotE (MotC chaperone)
MYWLTSTSNTAIRGTCLASFRVGQTPSIYAGRQIHMKLTLREIIIIAVTTMLSFPVIYLLLMFATGGARIEFNHPKKDEKKETQIKFMKLDAKKDSLAATQSQTFQANELQKADIVKEKQQLTEQQERVTMVEQELEKTRTDLTAEREKLEKLVSSSTDLDRKRMKQLAKVYGAMRAEEAARILETLDDDLCMNILSEMGDDRQKAKILTALSPDKAARVSRKISAPIKVNQKLK